MEIIRVTCTSITVRAQARHMHVHVEQGHNNISSKCHPNLSTSHDLLKMLQTAHAQRNNMSSLGSHELDVATEDCHPNASQSARAHDIIY